MRCLHVLSGLGPGGTRRVYLHYQQTLTELGYESIALVRPGSYVAEALASRAMPHIAIPYRRFFPGTQAHKLRALYHNLKPDWILVHNRKDADLWRRLAPEAQIIRVVHNYDLRALKEAQHILAVNPRLCAAIRSHNVPCSFLPNGLDLRPALRPPTPPKATITLGYLGMLRRTKGIFLLLHALSLLPKELKWSLVIQGKGPMRYPAKLYAAWKGLSTHIDWRDWQGVDSFYADIDVLVVPSRQESFGLVILEAWLRGCPVVATETDGPSWIFSELNQSANLCPMDPYALSARLAQLIRNPPSMDTPPPETLWQRFGHEAFKERLRTTLACITGTRLTTQIQSEEAL